MTTVVSVAIRNSLVREGLRRILADAGFEVAESADDLDNLDHRLRPSGPHILLIDNDLLGEDTSSAICDILHQMPHARIVVLVETFQFSEMAAVYTAGAYAYFLNQVPYQSLVAMMQMVSMGQKVAPPELIELLETMPASREPLDQKTAIERFGLSEREGVVLTSLERGLPNKAISRELGVSESAVKATVKSILKKLSVQNRTQAAILARGNDFVSHFPQETAGDARARENNRSE
ncbi:LuxR C-terminal-related transcriptional regulator [Altericroceibacterium xinjiangense]|uniref:LuxR C-terminal-related transcriptional regulator n=1 Tax=Altericroceibacterium xinjiangense TaxID=762261 RepID=UPI000F7EB60F|nr:response regulator transcription factor [Altericroceibacterium xinjiangense]